MITLSDEKFDWLFFDLGGVLIDESLAMKLRKDADLKIIRSYGTEISPESFEAEWNGAASSTIGDLDENIFRIFLKDELLVNEALKKLKDEKKSWPPHGRRNFIRPEAKHILKKLARSFKLGIIANQPPFVRRMLEEEKIIEYFSFLGLSDEYDLHKPDPKFFEKVLDATGADPERSIFVDDNPERGLLPTKQFGFTTVWLNENNLSRKDMSGIDLEIKSPTELVK